MDDRRLGLQIRALRRRRRWRQIDLARAAAVSQALVSLLERGHVDGVTVHTLRAVLAALDARLWLEARWRGGLLDRLLDERHATLVNLVVAMLGLLGWTVRVEVSFNQYGDRGSIDILAWHPRFLALLVVEVKTEVTSIEELHRRLDVKARIAPHLAVELFGARPVHVGTVVVLPETTASRSAMRRFAAVFDAAFPARGWAVRRWLRTPDAALRGILVLTASSPSSGKSDRDGAHVRQPAPHRIRRVAGASDRAA